MIDYSVRIVKSTHELCPQSATGAMTLYFEGVPTVKQIIHTARTLAMGHRNRPNFKSLSLRVYCAPAGAMTRCQIVS